MIVRHFIPPSGKRTGGLDTAIEGLDEHLRAAGVDSRRVEGNACPPLSERAGTPFIAHFHGLWEPGHWLLARRLRRAEGRIVVSPHGMLEPWAFRHRGWKKRPVFQFIERPRLSGADAVLATSRLEAQHLQSLLPKLMPTVLPLGVSCPEQVSGEEFRARARASLGLEPSSRMALFLSRIHAKKGLDLLLSSWLELAGVAVPGRAALWIVGPGQDAYAERCRSLAQACRDKGAEVRWIGPVWGEERWRYFAAADLFCLPSFSENFGFVVPEAWMCGTEVLTTDQTPWGENAGNEGVIVVSPEAGAVRGALAEWMGRDVLDPEQRGVLACWARERFSWSQLIPSYIALYASLLG